MGRIAPNEPVSAFDDNGNGRVDVAGVALLSTTDTFCFPLRPSPWSPGRFSGTTGQCAATGTTAVT